MHEIELREVSSQLNALLQTALNGEEVLILEDKKPILKLTRIDTTKPRRRRGSAKGLIKMSPDFDAPLDEFNEYMQ
jgi:antitoxin (DNA-binding transcriptional repressor) of toxin-antitoxin stability system